jgi:hypothetical protein
MPDRSCITMFLPTPLIFRYHLPLIPDVKENLDPLTDSCELVPIRPLVPSSLQQSRQLPEFGTDPC